MADTELGRAYIYEENIPDLLEVRRAFAARAEHGRESESTCAARRGAARRSTAVHGAFAVSAGSAQAARARTQTR